MDDLIEKLKSHIHWEEGMDESMLSSYIKQGQRYVKKHVEEKLSTWLLCVLVFSMNIV